jgi:hypothetical protein
VLIYHDPFANLIQKVKWNIFQQFAAKYLCWDGEFLIICHHWNINYIISLVKKSFGYLLFAAGNGEWRLSPGYETGFSVHEDRKNPPLKG